MFLRSNKLNIFRKSKHPYIKPILHLDNHAIAIGHQYNNEQVHLFMQDHENRKPRRVIISKQIPTNDNIHKMLIIIISLRWKHFVIIAYLFKIPTINEPYNQRKRDIKQTQTDILTA